MGCHSTFFLGYSYNSYNPCNAVTLVTRAKMVEKLRPLYSLILLQRLVRQYMPRYSRGKYKQKYLCP